jgi:hypothetical protein
LASTASTHCAFWHFKRLALHLFEFLLLVGVQYGKYVALHVVPHLFYFLTDTFTVSTGEDFTHAVPHFLHDAIANFLKLFRLSSCHFQLFGHLGILQCCDPLKLNVDLLQTLKLLGEQYFLKLFFHLGGSLFGLLTHFREKLCSLIFAHVAEVATGTFLPILLCHFGQSFFLIGRNLQFRSHRFEPQQRHGHVAASRATTTETTATATTKAAASATTAAASATTAALILFLTDSARYHKCQ